MKKRIYPHAWPGAAVRAPLTQEEAAALRCGAPGCDRTHTAPGGLARVGGQGPWLCSEHREVFDHSSHRLDLRQAQQRAVNLAVSNEQKRIAGLLEQFPASHVIAVLRALPPAPAKPAEPPPPEG